MEPAAQHFGEVKIPAEAPIIDGDIAGLQTFQLLDLLDGQRPLAHGAGFQSRLVADLIEQVIHDRQARLRETRARGPMLIGRLFPAKGLTQLRAVGQAQQRTVEAQEPVPAPTLDGVLRPIDGGQYTLLVQFDKSAGLELGAGMGDGARGDRFKDRALSQLIEKLVQMTLDGFDGFLENKEHQDRESQLAVASEILGSDAMAGQEGFIVQERAQRLDKSDEMFGNVMKNRLHPHVNKGGAQPVR
jgi:hypothetical protein